MVVIIFTERNIERKRKKKKKERKKYRVKKKEKKKVRNKERFNSLFLSGVYRYFYNLPFMVKSQIIFSLSL